MITNYPKNGKDGITPHIGSNNNWFIGNEDTGIRASGQSSTEIIAVVIAPDDWDTETNQVVIDCQGVSINEEEQVVTLSPALSSKETCTACEIQCVACNDDMLTLQAVTLPTEEVTIYVAITKANSTQDNSVQNNVYSTEETVVGTWIDGKPLYRKTVIIPSLPNATKGIYDVGLSNVSYKHLSGFVEWSDGTKAPIPFTDNSAVSAQAGVYMKDSDGTFVISTAIDRRTLSATVHLHYTKNADTATIDIPSATALMAAYEEGVNEA